MWVPEILLYVIYDRCEKSFVESFGEKRETVGEWGWKLPKSCSLVARDNDAFEREVERAVATLLSSSQPGRCNLPDIAQLSCHASNAGAT